ASTASEDPAVAQSERAAVRDSDAHGRASDRALNELRSFLNARDVSRLPPRLAGPLVEAQRRLEELPAMRAKVGSGKASISEVFELHRAAIQAFVRAIAGLTDLSDDGELLRSITSLVSLLQLEERMSREHALLAHVFAQGEFPPGSYRDLVSLISELDIYADVFRTTAAVEHQKSYDRAMATEATQRLLVLRRTALETTEEDLTISADEWFELATRKLALMASIERTLNDEVSSAVVGGVVLFSVIFAWILGSRVTRRVEVLRDASRRIAAGDLEGRVSITEGDELGQLGGAFNDMTGELGRARAALSNQARMARELEIAAQIQRA